MYGFTIIHGKNSTKIQLPICAKNLKISLAEDHFFYFGYNYFNKFENDKIFEEDTEFVIGLDGVILNLQKLKNSYGISNYFNLIKTLFQKNNIGFATQLKGEFSGFVFDKKSSELFYFNSKTGTKQIFYTSCKGYHIISESIANVIHFKERLNLTNSLNINAVYSMLTFGAMLEKETLVNEVFKLLAGKYLFLKDLKIVEKEYFSFNNIAYSIHSKKVAIDSIEETMNEALRLEYEKDKEYNYKHLATLSGGLDSRVNVMLSHKLGYKSKTFCFSQPNYLDDIISKKIAKSLDLEHQFISLKDGLYMNDLEENVSIVNGTQIFTGAAHYNYSLSKIDLKNYGLMHTGQIGDGIFGGFLTKGATPNFLSKTVSSQFLDKLQIDENFFKKYKNEEVFKLYQRVFNLTHSGSYTTEFRKTYLVSPFLDDDVISVALSIDPKLKYNQKIYIDWLVKKHPDTTNFIWERTGFKPNKKWKTAFSRYTNKIKKEYYNYTNQKEKLSMTPEDFWLENNRKIQEFYIFFFNENLVLLEGNKNVFSDVKAYYSQGNSTEKAIVLTILEMVKKFKLKV